MRKALLFSFAAIFCSLLFSCSEPEAYIFTYFKDNGQDGLHLAYSHDGHT